MLDSNLIRTQVLLASNPGPLAEAVIRRICAEAERYGNERAEAGAKGTLFERCPDHDGTILGLIRAVKGDLNSARRKQWKPR